MIFKIKNRMAPKYLERQIKFVNNVHERSLRNSNDFRLPNVKSLNCRKSLFYCGLKMYNQLPTEIKDIENLQTFKNKCRSWAKT